jgi:hypothetical protein
MLTRRQDHALDVGGDPSSSGQPMALRYTGGKWQRVTISMPAGFTGVFTAVRMLNADEGWKVVYPGKESHSQSGVSLLHYYNGGWTPVAAPLGDVTTIAPVGANDLWIASGNSEVPPFNSAFAHFQSGHWTTVQAPADVPVTDLRALSPMDIWANGLDASKQSGTTPVVVHSDGTSWSQTPLAGDRSGQVIEMLSATDGWAFGLTNDPSSPEYIAVARAEHFTNGAWKRVDWPYDDIQIVSGLTRVADGAYWAIGGYMIARAKPSDANVGYGGSLFLHYANGAWSQ